MYLPFPFWAFGVEVWVLGLSGVGSLGFSVAAA